MSDPATAVGANAVAGGDNSVALGANAVASAANAVALGQGSLADRANTVSVGNAQTGLARQITNVAPGVMPGDAVNLGQMQQAMGAMGQRAQDFAAKGVAAAMAMPSLPTLAAGRQWLGAAVGQYGSATALGVAWSYQASEALSLGAAVSGAADGGGARLGGRVQVGYAW